MRKPIYVHFTHILHKEKRYIKSFCYNIVENHLYTKFGKTNLLFLPVHVHSYLYFF